jgi:hypothetical protein
MWLGLSQQNKSLPHSVSDSDPIGSGFKKIEKIKKFHVLKCWMLTFEG